MTDPVAAAAPATFTKSEMMIVAAARELAGLAAAMRGLEALIFTGGIGENAAALRSRIVGTAAWMGLRLDDAANAAGERCINTRDSAVQLRVMRTNEEAVIARHAFQVGTLSAKR